MAEKIIHEVRGVITGIDYEKRIVKVKELPGAVLFELKWREKPEVVDDLMRKQKPGFRVKVTTTKDMNEDVPQFWITNCTFDEDYKKSRSAYAQSPEEQKLVLLQSNFRTGAMVFTALLNAYAPRIPGQTQQDVAVIFNTAMDHIRARAIADAVILNY
jgi:hypothetical protein